MNLKEQNKEALDHLYLGNLLLSRVPSHKKLSNLSRTKLFPDAEETKAPLGRRRIGHGLSVLLTAFHRESQAAVASGGQSEMKGAAMSAK